MVALKPYKPLDLNVNPFGIAQQLASPYDYNGTLKALQDWNSLQNNEIITDINQQKLEDENRKSELETKRNAVIRSKLEAGEDPLKINSAEIEKEIGNIEGYLKSRKLQDEEDRKRQGDELRKIKDISSISKSNPELAQTLAAEQGLANIAGVLKAPAQKGSGTKPDKPKPSKPQLWVNIANGDSMTVDANSIEQTSKAQQSGYMPQKEYLTAMESGLVGSPSAGQEEQSSPGMLEKFFGSASPAPTASPGALPKPPPGHLLVKDKATGEIKIVKK